MLYHRNTSWYFALGLILVMLSGIMLFGLTKAASAEERGFGHHEFMDSRYHHDHHYPVRGHFVDVLPRGHRVVMHGNSRYYFFEGAWYRPEGRRFIVIAPPFGLVVPFLPPYYTTVWVGGVPYYYANEAYYTQGPNGYVVVEPPKGDVSQAPPSPSSSPSSSSSSSSQIFIYPRQGQSEQKQAADRYECHRWAVSQTSFDPTQPPAGVPESQMKQKRADYQRAMGACLDGRGYTVK